MQIAKCKPLEFTLNILWRQTHSQDTHNSNCIYYNGRSEVWVRGRGALLCIRIAKYLRLPVAVHIFWLREYLWMCVSLSVTAESLANLCGSQLPSSAFVWSAAFKNFTIQFFLFVGPAPALLLFVRAFFPSRSILAVCRLACISNCILYWIYKYLMPFKMPCNRPDPDPDRNRSCNQNWIRSVGVLNLYKPAMTNCLGFAIWKVEGRHWHGQKFLKSPKPPPSRGHHASCSPLQFQGL